MVANYTAGKQGLSVFLGEPKFDETAQIERCKDVFFYRDNFFVRFRRLLLGIEVFFSAVLAGVNTCADAAVLDEVETFPFFSLRVPFVAAFQQGAEQ